MKKLILLVLSRLDWLVWSAVIFSLIKNPFEAIGIWGWSFLAAFLIMQVACVMVRIQEWAKRKMSEPSKHAVVSRHGYRVPLIGIPATATEFECELCHQIFADPTALALGESGQYLCAKCRE